MDEAHELIVKREGRVGSLIINRPEKRNRLTQPCLQMIREALEAFSKAEDLPVVLIRGSGDRAFSAGYDVSALPVRSSPETETIRQRTSPLEKTLKAIQSYPYPVIAMLNGHAYGGGCELAVGCDIRVAARRAKMGMPPAKLGLVYPYEGYRRFLNVLGFARSLEIFLTGREYDSEACLRMGLVNYVVEDEKIEDFTYGLAEEMAESAPLSLMGTKKALYKIAEYPVLRQGDVEMMRDLFVKSLKSEDMEEGRKAFLEKRKPRFKGR